MAGMFEGCKHLESVPLFDTSNVTDMDYMFDKCNSLQSVPLFDTSKVTSMGYMFYDCRKLQHIGGFKDLYKAFMETPDDWLGTLHTFKGCYSITRESCLNIFNNLYDVTNIPKEFPPEFAFEPDVIARLMEEDILIAVQKGWIISSY